MPAVACPGCRRIIPLSESDMERAQIQCARCNASFRPADHSLEPAAGPPPPPVRRPPSPEPVALPEPEAIPAAPVQGPSLNEAPAGWPAFDPPPPRWYHSPWLVLLVVTAGACLGTLLATFVTWAIVSIRLAGAQADAERELEKARQQLERLK